MAKQTRKQLKSEMMFWRQRADFEQHKGLNLMGERDEARERLLLALAEAAAGLAEHAKVQGVMLALHDEGGATVFLGDFPDDHATCLMSEKYGDGPSMVAGRMKVSHTVVVYPRRQVGTPEDGGQ